MDDRSNPACAGQDWRKGMRPVGSQSEPHKFTLSIAAKKLTLTFHVFRDGRHGAAERDEVGTLYSGQSGFAARLDGEQRRGDFGDGSKRAAESIAQHPSARFELCRRHDHIHGSVSARQNNSSVMTQAVKRCLAGCRGADDRA
jgi:hypothetical protein